MFRLNFYNKNFSNSYTLINVTSQSKTCVPHFEKCGSISQMVWYCNSQRYQQRASVLLHGINKSVEY